MVTFRDVSIRAKLMLVIMFTSSAALILAGVAFVTYDISRTKSDMVRDLVALAQVVGTNSAASLVFDDHTSAQENLSAFSVERQIESAFILEPDGEVFASYTRADLAPDHRRPLLTTPGHLFTHAHLVTLRDIMLDGADVGAIYIKSDLSEIRHRVQQYNAAGIVIIVVAILFVLLVSSRLQGLVSDPILGLAETANLISRKKNYSIRAVKHGGGEVGILIDGFNEMLEQIQTRDTALQASELRVRSVVESAADGIITVSDTGVLQSLNAAAEQMFGYRAGDILGKPVNSLIHSGSTSGGPNAYEELVRDVDHAAGTPIRRELEGVRRNGERFPMHVAVTAMRVGDSLSYTGIIRDITQERELERMKSDFVSSVSHEIRTPLTAIISSAKILMRTDPSQAEVTRKFTSIILEEGKRLTRLINNLLDLAKMDAGRLEWNAKEEDPAKLLQRIMFLCQGPCTEKGLALGSQVGEDLPTVNCDADQIIQVLMNLTHNAIKFTPAGGSIELSVDVYEKVYVRFGVRDTGIGIPEQNRAAVFERFKQLGSVLTENPKGTGLGLAICKEIIELHGGKIWIDSEVTDGCLFHFTVPVYRLASVLGKKREGNAKPNAGVVGREAIPTRDV